MLTDSLIPYSRNIVHVLYRKWGIADIVIEAFEVIHEMSITFSSLINPMQWSETTFPGANLLQIPVAISSLGLIRTDVIYLPGTLWALTEGSIKPDLLKCIT